LLLLAAAKAFSSVSSLPMIMMHVSKASIALFFIDSSATGKHVVETTFTMLLIVDISP
jgi:hypothetical protein